MSRVGDKTKTAFRITKIHFNSSGSVSGAEFKSYFPEGLIDIKVHFLLSFSMWLGSHFIPICNKGYSLWLKIRGLIIVDYLRAYVAKGRIGCSEKT